MRKKRERETGIQVLGNLVNLITSSLLYIVHLKRRVERRLGIARSTLSAGNFKK